jgi:hypothetical protein
MEYMDGGSLTNLLQVPAPTRTAPPRTAHRAPPREAAGRGRRCALSVSGSNGGEHEWLQRRCGRLRRQAYQARRQELSEGEIAGFLRGTLGARAPLSRARAPAPRRGS